MLNNESMLLEDRMLPKGMDTWEKKDRIYDCSLMYLELLSTIFLMIISNLK